MTGLLCLAVASLVGNVGIAMTSQANSFKTPIVDFMFQNFNTFVDKYNEFHDEDLIATKLLRSRDLILEDEKLVIILILILDLWSLQMIMKYI